MQIIVTGSIKTITIDSVFGRFNKKLYHFFILEFCELYQQGRNESKTKDSSSQTYVSTTCKEVLRRKNSNGFSLSNTKRRGRRRKMPSSEETNDTAADCVIPVDTKENDKEHDADGACKVNKDKPKHSSQEAVTNVKQRVTRSGRVVKEKKLEDYTETDILKEVLSDIENEENSIGDNKFEMDHVILEDEVIDPSFYAVIKKEINMKSEQEEEDHSFACEQCSFTTRKQMEFNDHSLEHFYAEKKCLHCDYEFNHQDVSMEMFKKHVKNHLMAEEFACNFCSKKFPRKVQLSQHLRKHSKLKQFSCIYCEASFKWKQALTTHMITHKKTKDHLCDVCGFATAHRSQLKAHNLIHTGDTFKCQEEGCTYETNKRSNLKFHMITHTRVKAHQCEICGTSFTLVKNLKRHMLLHKAERRYRCERCYFCTTRYDKLKEHYYKQHDIGVKPGKKLRITEYLKMKESNLVVEAEESNLEENIVEEPVIQFDEGQETIEFQVVDGENVIETAQIINVASGTMDQIPVQHVVVLHKDGVAYEVPLQKNELGEDVALVNFLQSDTTQVETPAE